MRAALAALLCIATLPTAAFAAPAPPATPEGLLGYYLSRNVALIDEAGVQESWTVLRRCDAWRDAHSDEAAAPMLELAENELEALADAGAGQFRVLTMVDLGAYDGGRRRFEFHLQIPPYIGIVEFPRPRHESCAPHAADLPYRFRVRFENGDKMNGFPFSTSDAKAFFLARTTPTGADMRVTLEMTYEVREIAKPFMVAGVPESNVAARIVSMRIVDEKAEPARLLFVGTPAYFAETR